MRTLVVHTGGIGDLVLATPAIRRLAEEGPVELLGRKERLEILVAGGVAERSYDLITADFDSVFMRPTRRLRGFLADYERAVIWMRDDGTIEASIASCGIPSVFVHPGVPPDGWKRHATEYYLRSLGYGVAPPLRLDIPPAPQRRDVLIHPGSGSSRKSWPLPNYLTVAEAIESAGHAVNWVLGPAELESDRYDAIPADRVVRIDSLLELAATLAATDLFIGNDSGITHLAAAVGAPVVAVFGPTEPEVWAPLGDHVRVVRGEPWPPVKEVTDALSESLQTR